jgi:hypothetical protein
MIVVSRLSPDVSTSRSLPSPSSELTMNLRSRNVVSERGAMMAQDLLVPIKVSLRLKGDRELRCSNARSGFAETCAESVVAQQEVDPLPRPRRVLSIHEDAGR